MSVPILSVYDANGNKIPIPAIKGDKGDKGDQGVQGVPGTPGTKGDTPVRGTDYWTAEDIATIKGYVDDAILGGAW